jgi:DNA primase
MSTIDEIKSRIDIVDLVSESVELRKSGKNYTGYCPFHPNTRTPALAIFPETGTWHCFGQCNEGGDIFKFVMKREGWDFPEALGFLAERAGVELKPRTPEEDARSAEDDRLRGLLEESVTFFRHQLLDTEAGKAGLTYLHGRGLTDDTIETFGLGYAPHSWDALTNYFTKKGRTEDDLLACGLVSKRDSGGIYDRFRHRIIFPIRDVRGQMAGFGARSLSPDDMPKYLNTRETPLFDKGHLLFGLNLTRKSIRAQDQAVIVEGYLDVIALYQAGFANAVSPMGTALTVHQLRLLKRLTRRIVLALDADTAGDRATMRGLRVARETLDRESDPVFDARGLLGYEARLQADIRVTTLPEGKDPDDVVNENPEMWAQILENARPIVIHVMETLAASRDMEDPKTKTEIAAQVMPLIKDIPSPIERDTYRQRLARLLKVDERTLLQDSYAAPPRRRRRKRQPRSPEPSFLQGTGHTMGTGDASIAQAALQSSSYRLESYCLGVLLRHPNLIYLVDRALQESGLGRLSVKDFQHSDHQVIYRLVNESLEQEEAEPVHYVLAKLPLSLMEFTDDILAQTDNVDAQDRRVLRDLLRALLDLRRRNLSQNIDQLRYLMEDAQQEGDLKAQQYQKIMSQHILARSLLDQAVQIQLSRSKAPKDIK